jgi:hypothetical protein
VVISKEEHNEYQTGDDGEKGIAAAETAKMQGQAAREAAAEQCSPRRTHVEEQRWAC